MTETVLITGASQGIGKAISVRFGEAGYNLVLAARRSELLDALADDLRSQFGVKVLTVPTDVRDSEQVGQLIQAGLQEFGTIDILVNNAGIYISGPAEEFTLEDWHQALDTNLWGYIHTIHALLPHLVERQRGVIVNICSSGGAVPLPYLAPYTTAKFAIDGLTRALHTELAPKGIHVCGIYPNLIKTSFLERAIFRGKNEDDRRDRRQQVEQILSTPFVEQPEQVAKAVWEAVQQKRERVFVGSAKVAVGVQSVLPQVVQWVTRKTFQHKDVSAQG